MTGCERDRIILSLAAAIGMYIVQNRVIKKKIQHCFSINSYDFHIVTAVLLAIIFSLQSAHVCVSVQACACRFR